MASTWASGTVSDMRVLAVCLGLLVMVTIPINLVEAQQVTSQDEFIKGTFEQAPVTPGLLWLDKEVKATVAGILGHPYAGMRIRYWTSGDRIAWILDEIGKEEPITVGVVTRQNRINSVSILEFRESRGGEVRYESFTRQFIGAGLDETHRLDNPIDGITGATLSVWAVTRVAELALYLSSRVNHDLPVGTDPDLLASGD